MEMNFRTAKRKKKRKKLNMRSKYHKSKKKKKKTRRNYTRKFITDITDSYMRKMLDSKMLDVNILIY